MQRFVRVTTLAVVLSKTLGATEVREGTDEALSTSEVEASGNGASEADVSIELTMSVQDADNPT